MCAKQFAQVVGELKVLLKSRAGKRTMEWSDSNTPATKKSVNGLEAATTSGFQQRGKGRERY